MFLKKLFFNFLGFVLLPSLLWGQTVDVEVGDSFFAPKDLTIQKGTTVRWTNLGFLVHTSTADAGTWNSGALSTNDSFQFTFNQPGSYRYYCVFHGGPGGFGMAGTVTVEDPLANAPSFGWTGLTLLFCALAGAGIWFLSKREPLT
ncbi:MAG: plastocyanin/azurin family copper-binding protein [candidate division Zixibacteria bacterium]|nr:plastocyanin/azurin family copper-binding protein [candidate division Zixibacteria bacterium]